MRPDMKKVVVERPRRGSRAPNQKFGVRLPYVPDQDYEDQPKRALGFESYRHSEKWFTDVLGPLERFLRKNVGRPWDKVYSELCAGLDKRKATGKHIFDHVDAMVEKNCLIGADGRAYATDWRGNRPLSGMYVHPRTGLLCEGPRETKRERDRRRLLAEDPSFLRIDDATGYQKHEGLWYCVKLKRVFGGWGWLEKPVTVWDIFFKKQVALGRGWYWVATEKKQCNRDELKEVKRLLAKREREIRRM